MKVASFLKVCQGESVEGLVWDTVARRALQVGDISASRTACNNFILAHGGLGLKAAQELNDSFDIIMAHTQYQSFLDHAIRVFV